MEHAAAALAERGRGPESLMRAAEVIRELEEYNRRTAQQLRTRGTELQGMVKMLTTAIGEISTAGEENVIRLRHIEGMVTSVSQVDDVRAVKAQLSACLDEIRKESGRQKLAASSTVERLRQDLELVHPGSFTDAVTALPVRAQAVELICNACESGQPAFAAVMVIDRLQAVNTAFGPEVGDQLLRCFSGHVRNNLPSGDRVFRWTGASLMALVTRFNKVEPLRDEIKQLMERKLEYTVRTATRSVRLPVAARWAIFPISAPSPLLIQKIDVFAAMQPARN
jgi:GGDEF domain-containing protein